MHDIAAEMNKICEHIPFTKELSACQGCSAVFSIGKCIGKIAFVESDYYNDSYDKLELTVISRDNGIIDRSYLEFRYVIKDIDRIEATDSGVEWISNVNKRILINDEYRALGNAAYKYFSVFASSI